MVRFARARGSKGANEKLPEDATPWWEMKAQLMDNREDSEDKVLETNWKRVVEREEKTKQNQSSVWADFEDEEDFKKGIKKKRKHSLECDQVSEETSNAIEARQKKKKDEDGSAQNNEEGESVLISRKKVKLIPSDQDESVLENENSRSMGKPEVFNDENLNEDTNNWGGNNSVPHNSRRSKQKVNKRLKGNKDFKRRKPDPGSFTMNINGRDVEIVRFEAFYVKKEDAQRLIELKKKLQMKGVPKKEIALTIKGERRRAEKALAREKKHVCFHCRQYGHNLSECPRLNEDGGNTQHAGTGLCYKCGSTEHTYFQCRVDGKTACKIAERDFGGGNCGYIIKFGGHWVAGEGDKFSFATCFICKEEGHISRQCPDNPRGMYPKGGACRVCGDVTHLKKDCPKLQSEKAEARLTLPTLRPDQSLEALDDDTPTTRPIASEKRMNKIVKF